MDELTFLSALHRPGTLVDAGAHEGLLTLPLAGLPAARVLAFEPLGEARAALSAAVAGRPNITVRPEALGDVAGTAELTVPVLDGAPQWQWASTSKSYAAHRSSRVAVRRESVAAITLDSLSLADCTAIKIDAEGAEYAILRGARETLARCRPLLTLELEERHAEGCTWAVPAFLDALGYETAFEHQGRWHPMPALHRPTMQRPAPTPPSSRRPTPTSSTSMPGRWSARRKSARSFRTRPSAPGAQTWGVAPPCCGCSSAPDSTSWCASAACASSDCRSPAARPSRCASASR